VKTAPITPARIEFSDGPDPAQRRPPRSGDFGDIYHPQVGALAQARHVFLQGNGVPARWAGRSRFVIVETGFGLGNNFLASWDAWRSDPARCERLCFVSIEHHPPTRADLERAHARSELPGLAAQLVAAWPPLTPNLHPIDFDGGRVQLLLALGDVATLLPALRLQADAIYLDGFAPARNPAMWEPRVIRALARLAAPGATAATWSVARELRDALAASGFEVQRAAGIGGKREITLARWAPRFAPRRVPDAAVASRTALVVGAGLAGAAVAQALAQQGLAVTVFERRAAPAAETSGNPGGIFHGTVHADDGPHARLFRAAALLAQRLHGAAVASGVPGQVQGLLRLGPQGSGLPAMSALLQGLGLPPQYVRAVGADDAARLAGSPLAAPAWFYAGGGWISPAAAVRHALATAGIELCCATMIERLRREGDDWVLTDGLGQVVARSALVVLANAADAARLLGPLGLAGWPLTHSRGQVTYWRAAGPPALALPAAGDGYALSLTDGGLLCGATNQSDDPDPELRQADHLHNIARLQRLTGLQAPAAEHWRGRVGWRLQADDRLPIAGPLPLPAYAPGVRRDQTRLLERSAGLFVLTALGARGLTLAPLLARLVAAQATGAPWPLEQDLADAVDPARWLVRSARASAAGAPADASGNRAATP
jgi:tRNA 5-methylaminomethyl-2-thiouridine biosynthesis bifunctional protein